MLWLSETHESRGVAVKYWEEGVSIWSDQRKEALTVAEVSAILKEEVDCCRLWSADMTQ